MKNPLPLIHSGKVYPLELKSFHNYVLLAFILLKIGWYFGTKGHENPFQFEKTNQKKKKWA
jgi:hypothetical protein